MTTVTVLATPVTQATSTASSGTLVPGGPNPINANSGAASWALPTPTAVGQVLGVEKTDSSVNAVTITGTIRGSSGSITLVLPNETIQFVSESMTSWRPVAGHKTLSSLDGRYDASGAAASKQPLLGPTSVKTANYTAVANDFVVSNIAGGNLTHTLPTAPADKTQVGFKVTGYVTGNTVTVQPGGSDTIDGTATIVLNLNYQSAVLQYQAASATWRVVASYLPTTGLLTATGGTVTGVLGAAVFSGKFIDPTLPGPWSATGMTASAGAYSSTNGAANATALASAHTYAVANGLGLHWPAGTWDLQGQQVFAAKIPVMMGAGVDITTLRFQTGAGLTSGTVDGSSPASAGGITITTADGFGTGYVLGNNTGNYYGPGGLIRDLTITSASSNAPVYSGHPSTAVGLEINGVTQMQHDRVRVSNFGVGFDLINNCGGAHYVNCTAPYHDNNLGMNMRTGAQSGSDIHLYNCWMHGAYGAYCIENGFTDLFVVGGQAACNHANFQNLTAPNDALGTIIAPRSWLDGTIGTDGSPGTAPTPGTGAVGLVKFVDTDFEGTRGGYSVARTYSYINLVIEHSNLISYQSTGTNSVSVPYGSGGTSCGTLGSTLSTGAPITSIPIGGGGLTAAVPAGQVQLSSAGNTQLFTTTGAASGAASIPVTSQTPNYAYPSGSTVYIASFGCPGLIKMTGAGSSSVIINGCTVKGAYTSTNLVQITGATAGGFTYSEADNTGKQITAIYGYNGGAALSGNWLQTDAVNNNITSLARFSGVSVNYRALTGKYADFAGTFVTGDGTSLQQSNDGVTFTRVIPVTGTPSSGQVPTATSGTAASWQTPAGSGGANIADSFLGDGSDGAGTISANTTLTRDMFYTSLTVNSAVTLKTGGFRIFCTGTCTVTGTISNPGGNGGATGGAGGIGAAGTIKGGVIGATGVTGVGGASTGATNAVGGTGGNGGSGTSGAGGTAGAPTYLTAINGGTGAAGGVGAWARSLPSAPAGVSISANGAVAPVGGTGGASGAGDGTNTGGGGGGGGGGVLVNCKALAGGGTISAPGGNGGTPTTGNAGGGGSGGGGWVVVNTTSSASWTGTLSASAGTAGSGAGTGAAGVAGGAGITQLNVFT